MNPDYKKLIHPVPGNIYLNSRPRVPVDGGYATVRSMGINDDGMETLIPTVHSDGYIMSDAEAMQHYGKTGQHLGKFGTVDQANQYAQRLHEDQARLFAEALLSE